MYNILNSLKKDGNMSANYGKKEEVIQNRKKFFHDKIPYENTIRIIANHSDKIKILDDNFLKDKKYLSTYTIETDCIFLTKKDIFVYIAFADCIPLVIYDKKKDILAFAHLSNKSASLNLHLKVIDKFINEFKSNKDDLIVEFGPSIKGESYVFESPYQLEIKKWKEYLIDIGNNNYEIHLDKYIYDDIVRFGIKKIITNDIDTCTNENYFSHYNAMKGNEKEGRFICGVYLDNKKTDTK